MSRTPALEWLPEEPVGSEQPRWRVPCSPQGPARVRDMWHTVSNIRASCRPRLGTARTVARGGFRPCSNLKPTLVLCHLERVLSFRPALIKPLHQFRERRGPGLGSRALGTDVFAQDLQMAFIPPLRELGF